MVPERISVLLTAYIDGELSSRKKRAVQRLLRKSPEARALLAQLQDDSKLLRLVPRPRLERDLSAQVLRSIGDRRLAINRRVVVAQRAPFPAWIGYAAAAAVLFAVFSGSYLYFYAGNNAQNTAHNNGHKNRGNGIGPAPAYTSPLLANNDQGTGDPVEPPTPPEPVRPTPEKPNLTPEKVAVETPKKAPEKPKATPETPKNSSEDVFTTRKLNPKFETFKEVTSVRDIVSLAMWEFEKEQSRKKVQSELEKDAAHRMELFFKSPRALERIEAAFKAQGVRLLVDQLAQTRMKNQVPTNYVLFVEDITPDEMTKILETLGIEDKKLETAKKGSGQFGKMYLLGMTNEDHEELRNLLGADPVKFGPPPKGPLGVDIRKPVSSKTASEVSDALSGKGVPRPGAGKPAAVPLTRQAIVVSYNPVRPPKTSKEIQQFLDSRPAKRPGTLQILLVLRANNG